MELEDEIDGILESDKFFEKPLRAQYLKKVRQNIVLHSQLQIPFWNEEVLMPWEAEELTFKLTPLTAAVLVRDVGKIQAVINLLQQAHHYYTDNKTHPAIHDEFKKGLLLAVLFGFTQGVK